MNGDLKKDYETAKNFWNSAFSADDTAKQDAKNAAVLNSDGRELAPSEKLYLIKVTDEFCCINVIQPWKLFLVQCLQPISLFIISRNTYNLETLIFIQFVLSLEIRNFSATRTTP